MKPLANISPGGHVHLIGICGTAMASLAALLRDKGFRVSGSDAGVYPPMSTFLAEKGIPVADGFSPDNVVSAPDLVVIGNAIARGNPELEHVLNSGLPYTSMPEALRLLFLPGKLPLVVSGTHGKTTTASMLAWSLEALGAEPSFLIGGIPENFGAGSRLGAGRHFVIEGDEYDTAYFDKAPKFFHYRPHILVINGIEYDHADIYPDLEAIVLQFRRLVHLVPGNGFIVYNGQCSRTCEVVDRAFCDTASFGLSGGVTWRAAGIRAEGSRTTFEVFQEEHRRGTLSLGMAGEHNVANSLAACAVLCRLGYPWERVQPALAAFAGVQRRMTLRSEIGGVRIFDDFAHHPSAIRLTLQGARHAFPGVRIWAVFEPRSWTCRKNVHQQAMTGCFDDADVVVIADVFQKEKLPEAQRFSPELAVDGLRERGRDAYFIPTASEIAGFIAKKVNPGDVIIIMSNGGFDQIHQKLSERISDHGQKTSGKTL